VTRRRRRGEDDREDRRPEPREPAWYANRETAAGIFHRPAQPVAEFRYENYRQPEPRHARAERPPPPPPPPEREPEPETRVITWLDE